MVISIYKKNHCQLIKKTGKYEFSIFLIILDNIIPIFFKKKKQTFRYSCMPKILRTVVDTPPLELL